MFTELACVCAVPLSLCVTATDKANSAVQGDPDATLFVARLGHQTTEGNQMVMMRKCVECVLD